MRKVIVGAIFPGRVRITVPELYQDLERAYGIEEAVGAQRGVHRVHANPASGRVLVEFDPEAIDLGTLVHTIAGARPVARPSVRRAGGHEPGILGEVMRLALSGIVLGGLFGGRLLAGGPLLTVAPLISIGSVTTLFAGYPIFRRGLLALFHDRRADMDTLISTATFTSLVLRESLTGLVVVWLINLGDLLEALTIRRARRAIRDLLSVGDSWVWIVVEGQEIRVPFAEVQVGHWVVAHQGEKIAVDGIVVDGEADVNQAMITGEALPVPRRPGDTVYAGTVVEAGHLVVQATAVGEDTTAGRIIRRVEEAREHRAPIHVAADHFVENFPPFSFALAATVFLLTRDFHRSLSMLVIACPCAAGLATPTAIGAAIGNAASRGILIKGGMYLEAAAGIDAVVFDKTGTLTTGVPRVTQVLALDPQVSPEHVLALAAAAERHSRYPFAAAVRRHAEEQGLPLLPARDYETLVGLGVRARIHGTLVTVGNRRLLELLGIPAPRLHEAEARGELVLWVVADDRVIGLIGIDEVVRPEAHQAVAELRAAGVRRLVVATGDRAVAAERIAHAVGLPEYRAGVLPEDKLSLIHHLQADRHRVAMVGDGINDAPALATADIGFALGTAGTDVAIEAADIALAGDDLRQVPATMRLSRHTLGVVRGSFAAAIGVNLTGVILAALGLISPLTGAVVHNLSTVAVVLHSARLIGYRDRQRPALTTAASADTDGMAGHASSARQIAARSTTAGS
ncbi:MAG: cation-translocating P-type ATPase [Chloroflexi bacterium]|nr:cation-translocating P-type ATPase [Chloroflexota bacterium]